MNSLYDTVRRHILTALYRREVTPKDDAFLSFPRYNKIVRTRMGHTPFFVVDRSIIQRQFIRLRKALRMHWGENAIIAYSFKTNYAIVQSNILGPDDVWAEVVSSREYALAKKLGYPGNHIIFNGPVKTNKDLELAIKNGSKIHIDNREELLRILSMAAIRKNPVSIGMRIHGKTDDLKESRFGFSIERKDARRALLEISRAENVRLESIHVHVGTDIDRKEVYRDAAASLGRFCNDAESLLGYAITTLDMGGGFPSSARKPFGRDDWHPHPIETYIQTISDSLKKTLRVPQNKRLIVEPGRFLVDDAVAFVTTVYDSKEEERVQKIVTDVEVTMLPLGHYRPQIVRVFAQDLQPRPDGYIYTIMYGGSCKENDVLHEGRFSKIKTGDRIVYYCVGAYNQSMGSDFIFGKIPMYTI